jgi:basic membrane protein A
VCLTPAGEPDPAGVCAGDAATLAPNYQAVGFGDAESAYLAGIVAATVSGTGTLGVVGGASVDWVVRTWRGFENGARSVDPDAEVRFVELAADAAGFADPAVARSRTDELIAGGVDVVFQVAGDAGTGVLEGACAAGVRAIGSIGDQAAANPALACIVTSAERRVQDVVVAAIRDAAAGELAPGRLVYGLGSEPPGSALAPITGVDLSQDAVTILDAASRAVAAGELDPCAPVRCTPTGS